MGEEDLGFLDLNFGFDCFIWILFCVFPKNTLTYRQDKLGIKPSMMRLVADPLLIYSHHQITCKVFEKSDLRNFHPLVSDSVLTCAPFFRELCRQMRRGPTSPELVSLT